MHQPSTSLAMLSGTGYRNAEVFLLRCGRHYCYDFFEWFLNWVCLKAQHRGPNKYTLIYTLYEYSDTAVCDTEIAAGVLGPHRYPSAMPG